MAIIKVEVDKHSGFCFGVVKAVEAAESLLKQGQKVWCVGDIVHNEAEANRLMQLGMSTIQQSDFDQIKSGTVLFRAHGEPPASYQSAQQFGLTLKDATCPVVLKLQKRVKQAYLQQKAQNGQIIIYGKKGHAEVIGLIGQTNNEAIVVETKADMDKIDFSRPVEVFSQTTKSPEGLQQIVALMQERTHNGIEIISHDTVCRQVSGRVPRLQRFAEQYDAVVFVGGTKSSNARMLFQACQDVNALSYFISEPDDLQVDWFTDGVGSVGVCGATSTPEWLMEQVAEKIRRITGIHSASD
ncbi:MAG: 4-hydroxy-3-methylbut-2-enyl diphosphate reductase [Marinilabiliaceae bacterium]|nr:4-hydroxy-3-methylbut-2-enyl diphosphate reductase [Marinilabiliaceae bacterium]